MKVRAEEIDPVDLALLVEGSATGMILFDGTGLAVYANDTARTWVPIEAGARITDLCICALTDADLCEVVRRGDTIQIETGIEGSDSPMQVLAIGRPLGLETVNGAYLLEISNISAISRREISLRRLVLRDTLTGVASRRHFFDLGEQALADSRETRTELTVGMLDIDHFKQVNDLYGHTTGDLVLSVVAACCSAQLRRNDVIGRLGGDEFGLIMPATSLTTARVVADRLRHKVAEAMQDEPDCKIKVTVSIGLTEAAPGDNSFDSLLVRADNALYQAKRAGRNRTEERAI